MMRVGSGEKDTLLTEKIGLAVDGLKSFSKRSVISEVGKSVRELLPAFSCASVCFQKIKFSIYTHKAVLFDRSPVICPVFFPFIKDPGILYQLSSLIEIAGLVLDSDKTFCNFSILIIIGDAI